MRPLPVSVSSSMHAPRGTATWHHHFNTTAAVGAGSDAAGSSKNSMSMHAPEVHGNLHLLRNCSTGGRLSKQQGSSLVGASKPEVARKFLSVTAARNAARRMLWPKQKDSRQPTEGQSMQRQGGSPGEGVQLPLLKDNASQGGSSGSCHKAGMDCNVQCMELGDAKDGNAPQQHSDSIRGVRHLFVGAVPHAMPCSLRGHRVSCTLGMGGLSH